MISGNGANFVGTATELRETLNIFDQKRVQNFLTMKDIGWRLTPLSAYGWEVVGNHS